METFNGSARCCHRSALYDLPVESVRLCLQPEGFEPIRTEGVAAPEAIGSQIGPNVDTHGSLRRELLHALSHFTDQGYRQSTRRSFHRHCSPPYRRLQAATPTVTRDHPFSPARTHLKQHDTQLY
jgi:hypothetical protein